MTTNLTTPFGLLRALWLDREATHDALEEYWDKNGITDALIGNIAPSRDEDTLLAQLRALAVEQGWAEYSPAGLIVLGEKDDAETT